MSGGSDNKDISDPGITTGNVFDVTPPSLLVPSQSIILDASTLIGATVNYESTAIDNIDGPITPHCYPRSGLMFPIGESVVKCNATDKAGNTSERAFGVIVKPFKLDEDSLQLLVAIIIAVVGAAIVLMIFRNRRRNLLDNDIVKQRN